MDLRTASRSARNEPLRERPPGNRPGTAVFHPLAELQPGGLGNAPWRQQAQITEDENRRSRRRCGDAPAHAPALAPALPYPQGVLRRFGYGPQAHVCLAVQPLDGWREMWVLRRNEAGWTVDVLPPSGNAPDLGYVEFAGWVPGGTQMLVAREVRQDGRMRRSFETVRLDSLLTDKKAEEPSSLSTFYRWQDAQWKKLTVSLR